MDERVRAYLEKKRASETSRFSTDRSSVLIEAGLYEKVYSPDGRQSEDYSYAEITNAGSKYYKKEPLKVSDEEYVEILKYANKENSNGGNSVAGALKGLAILEFIGGLFLALASSKTDLGGIGFLSFTLLGAFSGLMFLGFAEIIKLLDAIKNK